MSKDWIIVHDHQNRDKVVKEIPTTPADQAADFEKARAEYPLPRYSLTYAGSTQSTTTGSELLKGWDTEGFPKAKDAGKEPVSR